MTKPTHLLVVELAERFRKAKGRDISRNQGALIRLLAAVERGVSELETAAETEILVPYIAADERGPIHLRQILTREDAMRIGEVESVERLQWPDQANERE